MASVAEAQLRVSEAIQIGLRLEAGPTDSLEARSVATAPKYLELIHETQDLFQSLDLGSITERKLMSLAASLIQMQDSFRDLDATLRTMRQSGRAAIAGQEALVEMYLTQTALALDWLDGKIESFSISLDSQWIAEINRRIERSPVSPAASPYWKQDLASLCD